MDATEQLAGTWRRFARVHARGRSPVYEEVAERVAGDAALLAVLAARPAREHQPNLLLAAVQYLAGPGGLARAQVNEIGGRVAVPQMEGYDEAVWGHEDSRR